MASISYYFDTRRAKSDGTFPLKLKISIDGKKGFLINLKLSLSEDQWSGSEIIGHPSRKHFNPYIKKRYADVYEALFRLEVSGEIKRLSMDQIKARLSGDDSLEQVEYTLNEHFTRFISTRKSKSTKSIYRQTLIKIEAFSGQPVPFQLATFTWMREFESFLYAQGVSVNTVNIHFRNIRAVFNDAINEDRIDLNLYPFRKFKLKSEQTKKRALTIDQLRSIKDWPCEEHEQQYIDIFMLIFYLRGINIIDLANLKEITADGRLVEYLTVAAQYVGT